MKKRCIVLLRGGVSPKRHQYPSIRPSRQKPEPVSMHVVASSIRRHLIEINPQFDFTFVVHSWDGHLREIFDSLYSPRVSKYESNDSYRGKIMRLMARSWLNDLHTNGISALVRIAQRPRARLAQDFAGISQAISISESANLALSDEELRSADKVVLLRPDVVILKDIHLANYDPGVIYCNQHLDKCGDFRWVFDSAHLQFFSKLITAFSTHRRIHRPHTWIRDFAFFLGYKYEQDLIKAGKHEEVLRKTRSSGIELSKLTPYGLDEFEYLQYGA